MLYDNALLSRQYLHLYQLNHDPFIRTIVEGTLDYVVREMTDSRCGFYSTQDADSEGHEGKFFVWTVEDVEAAIGGENARLFNSYFNVTPGGNFEGKNILNINRPAAEIAEAAHVPVAELLRVIEAARKTLFEVREQRIKPARDEKVLTAWNGLMLASFAEAAAVLEREDYAQLARSNARFVLENLYRDGLLLRTWKDGQAKLNGYLEDYAFFIDGLLALFETTGEFEWLDSAIELSAKMIDEFWDESDGGFFFTGKSHEELIVRSKDFFDNATPSGNSVAADVLLRLSVLTGSEDYARKAITIFRLNSTAMQRYPAGFGRVLCALDFHLAAKKEIVLLGEAGKADTQALEKVVWNSYLPNKILVKASDSEAMSRQSLPLLQGRTTQRDVATAYVCENFACQQPVTTAEELRSQLLAGTVRDQARSS
jgi:hypothetical protein